MKKFLSVILSAAILFSVISSSAYAASSASLQSSVFNTCKLDCNELSSSENEIDIDNYYDKLTISFSSDIRVLEESPNGGSASRNLLNENNIGAAKEYVTSLNLEGIGLKYIEDACLNQLDNLENSADGSVLTSYSVLIPKDRASINPTYYKTIGNIDYYYAFYSSYTQELKRTRLGDRMKSWADGVVDIIMEFAQEYGNVVVPIQFTMFLNLINAPIGYEIMNESYTENYFTIEAECRGIFTKDPNHAGAHYPWMLYYSAEKGYARASSIWHPLDLSLPEDLVSWTSPTTDAVNTNHFYDMDWNVQTASYCFMTGVPIYARLADSVANVYWG